MTTTTPSLYLGFLNPPPPDHPLPPNSSPSLPLPSSPFDPTEPSKWEGGQLGGKPFFILPPPPPSTFLSCGKNNCTSSMQFLLQLYAPLPDKHASNSDDAYHRMVYVFVCRGEKSTLESVVCTAKNRNVKVLRSQCSQNDYDLYLYPTSTTTSAKPQQLCSLCGFPSTLQCPLQNKLPFCSKPCQSEYLKCVFKKDKKGEERVFLGNDKSRVMEGGWIDVDDEDFDDDENDNENNHIDVINKGSSEDNKNRIRSEMQKLRMLNGEGEFKVVDSIPEEFEGADKKAEEDDGDDQDEGEEEDDKTLTQAQMNKITGSTGLSDETTIQFLSKVQKEPEAIIRYCLWEDEMCLYVRSSGECLKAEEDEVYRFVGVDSVPAIAAVEGGGDKLQYELTPSQKSKLNKPSIAKCKCGSERVFEFQIMPQLLYLLKDQSKSANEVVHKGVDVDSPQPPSKEEIEIMKNNLMNDKEGGVSDWDFGTIAVYTCQKNCGLTEVGGEMNMGVKGWGEEVGVVEEGI